MSLCPRAERLRFVKRVHIDAVCQRCDLDGAVSPHNWSWPSSFFSSFFIPSASVSMVKDSFATAFPLEIYLYG